MTPGASLLRRISYATGEARVDHLSSQRVLDGTTPLPIAHTRRHQYPGVPRRPSLAPKLRAATSSPQRDNIQRVNLRGVPSVNPVVGRCPNVVPRNGS